MDRIRERDENPHHSEMLQRPALKIKQSLTRDFSIENLKRYAGSHKRLNKSQIRTPSERNKTIDEKLIHDKSRTPVMQTYGNRSNAEKSVD